LEDVFVVEGQLQEGETVEGHTETEDVRGLSVVTLVRERSEDFWSHEVVGALVAAKSLLRRLELAGGTEVAEQRTVFVVEEDVLRLYVSVDDVALVHY